MATGHINAADGTYFNSTNGMANCNSSGDADLQAIMQTYGLTSQYTDVSYLKFDFVTNNDFISFDYIFASDEYGTFQCQFGDGMAFLLTDLVTGVVQNLAVLPNTNTPVAVTNIRNNAHNTMCGSVNPEYFAVYNASLPTALTTINAKGHTVPLTAFANVIPNHPYSLKIVIGDYLDAILNSYVLIRANSLESGNPEPSIFEMNAFLDENDNGVKDTTEQNFNLGYFTYEVAGESTEPTQIYSNNGTATLFLPDAEAAYNLAFHPYPEYADYYNSDVTLLNITASENNADNVFYFPVTNTAPYEDIAVSLTATTIANAGFLQTLKLKYTNLGTSTTSGSVSFTHSNSVTISSVSEAVTTTTNGFTFSYEDLAPLESRSITIVVAIPPIPTVSMDEEITYNSTITSNLTDINTGNNSSTLNSYVQASYDPNDVTEAHGPQIVITEFNAENDYLYYTIRFQNTGTANTTFVRIEDYLDFNLDPKSVRMVDASHDYQVVQESDLLTWYFDNLSLTPSDVDLAGSMGYVTFKVKLHPDYENYVGNEVINQAAIYFDYNPVIYTNTYVTEFINEPVIIEGDTLLCPNGEGTAQVVGSEVYDTYQWYYKYWFSSDNFVAIDGADSASFTYDWATYDQALLKVVVTKDGVTSESNELQIDSYAWLPISVSLDMNEDVTFHPDSESYTLCEDGSFTVTVNQPYDIVKWYKDDTLIEGATDASYPITQTGTYYAIAAPSFCPESTSTTFPIVVTVVDCDLNTDIPSYASQFELYPNPVKEMLYVNNNSDELTTYRIVDISGKLIANGTVTQSVNSISLHGLSQGIYFINLSNSTQQTTLKFVKN